VDENSKDMISSKDGETLNPESDFIYNFLDLALVFAILTAL
tara:strand:- start:923 stop:1045 length:123 start_codon:yes stop_codon:yes gene_type:complete